MQRYFVNELNGIIVGDDAKHITKVMRMKINDLVIICSNNECFNARLISLSDKEVTYKLEDKLKSINYPKITLYQGMPKYSKVDIVSKYATIYGANEISFVQMNRSEAKIKQIADKLNRLEKISKEAAELAHRNNYAKISFTNRLKDIPFNEFDIVLFADEVLKEEIVNYPIDNLTDKSKIAIIIGPEGGITEEERNFLIANKACQTSLGPYILPTEIASIYLLSVISAKFMNFV